MRSLAVLDGLGGKKKMIEIRPENCFEELENELNREIEMQVAFDHCLSVMMGVADRYGLKRKIVIAAMVKNMTDLMISPKAIKEIPAKDIRLKGKK